MRKRRLLQGAALALAVVVSYGSTASAISLGTDSSSGDGYTWGGYSSGSTGQLTLNNNAAITDGINFADGVADAKIICDGNITISNNGGTGISGKDVHIIISSKTPGTSASLTINDCKEGINVGGSVNIRTDVSVKADSIGISANKKVEIDGNFAKNVKVETDKADGKGFDVNGDIFIGMETEIEAGEYADLLKVGGKIEIETSGHRSDIKIDGKPIGGGDEPVEPEPESKPEPAPVAPAATKSATIAGLSGDSNSVSVEASNGNVAISEISKDLIQKIATSDDNGNGIVLDVSKASSQKVTKVSLTKDTMANIAEVLNSSDNNKESLVVKIGSASVSLDSTALAAVVSQAGDDIQIVVQNKNEAKLSESQNSTVEEIAATEGREVIRTFEAFITSGGSKISDFNGGEITIGKIDFKVPNDMNPANFTVYAISENGDLNECETWSENGYIFFSTGYLSDYVLVYDMP